MLRTTLSDIHRLACGELIRIKKLFIINSILLAASLFFTVVGVTSNEGIYLVGIFFEALTILTLTPAVAMLFRDMTDKRVCDVMHSMPMTASQRYWSKILALCYYHLIPTIVVGLFDVLLIYMDNSEVATADELIRVALIGAVYLLFTTAVSILCQMCFGTLAETIYMTIIALTVFTALPILVFENISYAAGQHYLYDSVPMIYCLWTFTSAAALDTDTKAFSLIAGIDKSFSPVPLLIINMLISIAVIALCVKLYKKRTAETVGTPISFKVFLEALSVIAVYVMFSYLDMLNRTVAIGSALVVFMVIHIILSRGKSIRRLLLTRGAEFAVMIIGVLVLRKICFATGGFGMVYMKPDKDISHPEVSVTVYTNNSYWDDDSEVLMLADATPEQIDEITEIVHSHFKPFDSNSSIARYDFEYYVDYRVELEVLERIKNKNMTSSLDSNYYWDEVFMQSIRYDCEPEELIAELEEAGMVNVTEKEDYFTYRISYY